MPRDNGSTRFDRDTGQVYREQLVTAAPRASSSSSSLMRIRQRRKGGAAFASWHQQPAYTTTPRRRQRPGQRGPASLLDLAVKVVADNIERVGVNALRRCPDTLIWRVWDYLDHRRRGINFHAWKIILLALPNHIHPRTGVAPPRLLNYHQMLENVLAPLQTYLKPLTASPFDFLTGVVIGQGARFAEAELLALPRLRNLAFLALVQARLPYEEGFPRVTDRLIREWALLPDPFPALRSLVVTNQGQTTARSLASVARFPTLEMYAVGGRRADWEETDDDSSRAVDGCWRRRSCKPTDDLVAMASALLPPGLPYAKIELGESSSSYRDRYERQYVFHRERAGDNDDPGPLLGGLGLQSNKRKREGAEESKKQQKGQDAAAAVANAQQGPSQAPPAKRFKGLQDVFRSFGS